MDAETSIGDIICIGNYITFRISVICSDDSDADLSNDGGLRRSAFSLLMANSKGRNSL